MDSIKPSRRGPGRYLAAALAAVAAVGVAVMGGGATAYAAPRPGVPVTPIVLGSDWSGSAGFGSGAPGWYVDTSLVGPALGG